MFKRLKGDKQVTKELNSCVSELLLSYLHSYYGADLGALAPDAPLWINMSDTNLRSAIE